MAVTAEAVLDLLDGWEIKDPSKDQTSVAYAIDSEEIDRFITKARIRAAGQIELENIDKLPTTPLVDEAVATWTAGLLWNKKITKVTEGKEDSDPTTYGDKKIAEAKALLKSVNLDPTDDDKAGGSLITVFSINGST
nr:hypothetical protein [uncultured Methanobacterium sp.]